jgi:hypothetical protein
MIILRAMMLQVLRKSIVLNGEKLEVSASNPGFGGFNGHHGGGNPGFGGFNGHP